MSDDFWDDDLYDEEDDAALTDSENVKRRAEHRRNKAAERRFEEERDKRLADLQSEQRIRRIVGEELTSLVLVVLAFAFVWGMGDEYGVLAGVAAFLAVMTFWWFRSRHKERHPSYMIEEVDDLAEQTATHNRIADMAEAGEEWLRIKGEDFVWGRTFAHPFWQNVNAKVREYTRMSHNERLKDHKAARARSLPYRKAMDARLKAIDIEWSLPAWAAFDLDERSKEQSRE